MSEHQVKIRVVYHIHIKTACGIWFDKEFLAKDDKRNELKLRRKDTTALTLAMAKLIAGDTGVIWKITTVSELIVQETRDPE